MEGCGNKVDCDGKGETILARSEPRQGPSRGKEVKGGDGGRDRDRRYLSWGHLPPVLLMQCDYRRPICGRVELLEKPRVQDFAPGLGASAKS